MDTYTIKEVSEMFHLPSSTLRYYEDLGILTNVGRSKSGQRVYIQGHINRLKTICCFKKTGMSIAKLQQFFACEEDESAHIDEILSLLNDQQEHILNEISQLLYRHQDKSGKWNSAAKMGRLPRVCRTGKITA